MAPKRRAEGAGCVFLGKTRRGAEETRGEVYEGEGRVERETREKRKEQKDEKKNRERNGRERLEWIPAGKDEKQEEKR